MNSDGKRADHISIENTNYGGTPAVSSDATAWLEYQLRGNRTAATAFYRRPAGVGVQHQLAGQRNQMNRLVLTPGHGAANLGHSRR